MSRNYLITQNWQCLTLNNAIEQCGHKPGKPGILGDFSEHGKLRELSGNSVQPQGKIVTNKVFLVRHLNICVKQMLTV